MHIDLTQLPSIDTLDARGKTVFVRIDVNGSEHRIVRSIPTIKDLRRQGARVVLLAHFGRPLDAPEGERARYSLKPIAKFFEKKLKIAMKFVPASSGPQALAALESMKPKEVVMLENVRFDPREKPEMSSLVREWGLLADAYVFDGFAVSHRSTGSTTGLIRLGVPAYAGRLMEEELRALVPVVNGKSKKPRTALIGGNKLDTKVDVLRGLIPKVDVILLGGLITEPFLVALKKMTVKGLDPEYIKIAKSIMTQAKRAKVRLILSEDFLYDDGVVVSIGPETVATFEHEIARAKTIFWNGVVGIGDIRGHDATMAMAKAVKAATARGATTIVGGGSVLEFLEKKKFKDAQFSHVSTGGGALLELLTRKAL